MSHVLFRRFVAKRRCVRDDVIQCSLFSQGMTQLSNRVRTDEARTETTKQAAISHLFRDSKTQTLHDVVTFSY